MGRVNKSARLVCCGLLRAYQLLISPIFGNCCRFYPSCSYYAIEAIKTRGLFMGFALTLWRLCRCHPGCKGGLDPVPAAPSKRSLDLKNESLFLNKPHE